MPLVTRFETPGALRDLPAGSPFYDKWHGEVSSRMGTGFPGSGGAGEFYNPSLKDVTPTAQRDLIWMGFPRKLLVVDYRDNRRKAFAAGEKRDVQVEYLEWHVLKNTAGKIKRVTFTTELPEYWKLLATVDRNRVVSLYRELVDPPVTDAQLQKDLFPGGGAYNPKSKWNTTEGIVHFIVGINTLNAAVGIAKESVGLGPARDNYELHPFEFPTSADPRIQTDFNAMARRNLAVTLREPVGLYMVDWDDTGFAKPDGSPVGNYWRVVRGKPGAALRLVYEVPASEGFLVGDIRIGGRPIEFGGQIAEQVSVGLGGISGPRPAAPRGAALVKSPRRTRTSLRKQ